LNNSKYLKDLNIIYDFKQNIFYNLNLFNYNLNYYNGKIKLKNNIQPIAIQGNGNNNLNDICKNLKIKQSKVKLNESINYYSNSINYYLVPALKNNRPIILLFILLLFFLVFKIFQILIHQ